MQGSTLLLLRRLSLFFLLFCLHIELTAGVLYTPQSLKYAEAVYGKPALKRMQSLHYLLKISEKLGDSKKLSKINTFFNRVPYREDQSHWGKEDYWASPYEFIASGGGDCEDYTIAKYFSLISSGVYPQRLMVAYVKRKESGESHMVLLYRKNSQESLVLDNTTNEILPLSKRTDLEGIFVFNQSGMWVLKEQNQLLQVPDGLKGCESCRMAMNATDPFTSKLNTGEAIEWGGNMRVAASGVAHLTQQKKKRAIKKETSLFVNAKEALKQFQ